MRSLGLGLFLVLIGLTRLAAVAPSAEIPSPRPHGWIVDQAHLLAPATVTDLDRLLDEVHRHEGAEMAIVTVETINGANPRQYATDLFNRWGLGDRERNNGLLLFVALRDRKAEIILGRGLASSAHVSRSDRIMQETIVPHFRSGDSAGAVAAGARACASSFFGLTLAPPVEAAPPRDSIEVPSRVPPHPPAVEHPHTNASPPATLNPAFIIAILCGTGLGGAALLWFFVRRAGTHTCSRCHSAMTKLDESQDDAHLAPGERAEEGLGSVNYDVWLCPTCTGVEKVRHGRWFTRYSECPRCGAKTAAAPSVP
ncbi:MAG: TPM domain-containing protein [Opitutaceae bacterium]|nr:TPM domain-containing protein [Opitutaceae bacterium]